ncbi:MAG TPA: hypothetical protein VF331_14010 [Polyangiales bacterium]
MPSSDKHDPRWRGLILLGWCLVVALTTWRHEYWRDEIRAFALAMDAKSLRELPALLRDEGHPMLWHVLLHVGYRVTSSKLVLPVTSALICAGAVVIFVFKSPFPRWFQALFVFGGLPLYEYSVMARNYGISMLLLFMFASAYPSRKEHPLRLGLLLAALGNTNIHSLILACLLMALWLWDTLVNERISPFGKPALQLYAAAVILAVGAAAALATLWPTNQMVASDSSRYTLHNVVDATWTTLRDPAHAFQKIAPGETGVLKLLSNLLFAGSTLGLLVYPPALVAAWSALFSLSILFQVVYSGGYRHQGLFVVFLITLYWLVAERGLPPLRQRYASLAARFGTHVALPAILAILVVTGGYKVYVDLLEQQSASQALGAFLRAHREYAGAVLIGEPDFYLESLRYYADNPVYVVREHRFGATVKFVRRAQQRLRMGELLQSAQDVQARTHKPVLLVLGHLKELDPGLAPDAKLHELPYSFGRTFAWSADELVAWNARTKLLHTFADGVVGDERYRVYELVPPQR